MEAILPNGTTQMLSHVNDFNFNWHNNYVYADDAGAAAAEGHHPPHHRVARQHDGEQEQPGSESVGRLGRPHRRRDGARLGQNPYMTDEDYQAELANGNRRPIRRSRSTTGLSRTRVGTKHQGPRTAAVIVLAAASVAAQRSCARANPRRRASVTAAYEGLVTGTRTAASASSSSTSIATRRKRSTSRSVRTIGSSPAAPIVVNPPHFLPRRQWGVFTITVPADFGDKKLHLDDRRQRQNHVGADGAASRLRGGAVQGSCDGQYATGLAVRDQGSRHCKDLRAATRRP